MKTCSKCGQALPSSAFYASRSNADGLFGSCKECVKASVRENRKRNAEYYQEYDRKRFQEDPNVKARHRRYRKTKAGKAALKRSRDKWSRNNQDKRAAHILLKNAVKSGRVVKPDQCSKCGKVASRIEGHHDDYAKPLDVVWLCRACHVKEHQ